MGDDVIVILNSACLKFVAEWLSESWDQVVVWNVTADNDVVYITAQLQNPAVFNEFLSLPDWGTLYHAMRSVSSNSAIRFSHS